MNDFPRVLIDIALEPYTARDDLLALRVEREEIRLDRARLIRERDDLERIIRERDHQLAELDSQIEVAEALMRIRRSAAATSREPSPARRRPLDDAGDRETLQKRG